MKRWTREKSKGNLCKLDLEKAFDHVIWEYFDFIMMKIGFGAR